MMASDSTILGFPKYRLFFRLLQVASFSVFLGRGLQHLLFGAPYRTLLWDETWMSWLVEGVFKTSWSDYVTSSLVDESTTLGIKIIGVFYLFCAFISLFIQKLSSFLNKLLLLGAASLVFLAFLYFKERFFQLAQFLEYSLQFGAPVFLYLAHRQKTFQTKQSSYISLLKIAIAITFIAHGLYAVGYYPRPGNFMEMVLNILSLSDGQVKQFLLLAGSLDFIAAIAIFLPRKLAIPALIYIIFWGFMTTIARLWSYFQSDFWQETLLRWLPESIMRFPHFLIPLAVLVWYLQAKRNAVSINYK